MWPYLERSIEAAKGYPNRIASLKLIEILRLPPASWHLYPSTRKRQFEKAIKELKDLNIRTAKDNAVFLEWAPASDEKEDNYICFGYKEFANQIQLCEPSKVPEKTSSKADKYYDLLNEEDKKHINKQVEEHYKSDSNFSKYSVGIQTRTKLAYGEELSKALFESKYKSL